MGKKGKSRKKEALHGILFVAPAAVGTLIFFLFPFLISVFYSFMDGVATRRFVGLQNYIELLGNKTFQMAVGNTARFVIVAIPLLNLVALTLAFLLMRMRRKTRDFLRSTYIFPLVLPVASVVLFFEFLFHELFHKGATCSYRHASISSRSRRKASWICRPAVLRVRPICAPITRCGWRRK